MRRALAISLLAHAWLLALGGPRAVPPREAGALHATLQPVRAPLGDSAAPTTPIIPIEAVTPRPALPQERLRAAPVVAGNASAPSVRTSAPATHEASTPSASDRSFVDAGNARNAPSSPAAGGAGGGRSAQGGRGGQDGDDVDADGLRQYRLALAREARRYKRYPERALLAGVGGTAEVRVEHAAGTIPVARLARSSGDATLDTAALAMMREAAPRTAVPETLRGRSFAVSLPVIFDASAE